MEFDANAKHFVKKAYFITDRRFMNSTESSAYTGCSYGTFGKRKNELGISHTYRVASTYIFDRRDLEKVIIHEMCRQITKNGKKSTRYFQQEDYDEYLGSQRYLLRKRYKHLESEYFRYLWSQVIRQLQESNWTLIRYQLV